MGSTLFDQLIEEKVYPIFGDLTEPNIGLSNPDFEVIKSQTNVIFHCAGNVDGSERIESSVKVIIIIIILIFFLGLTKMCVYGLDQYLWYSSTFKFGQSMSLNICIYSLIKSSTIQWKWLESI
jgi:hypothetical protein